MGVNSEKNNQFLDPKPTFLQLELYSVNFSSKFINNFLSNPADATEYNYRYKHYKLLLQRM